MGRQVVTQSEAAGEPGFFPQTEELAALRTAIQSSPLLLIAIDQGGTILVADGGGLPYWQTVCHLRQGQSVYDLLQDSPEIVEGFEKALLGQGQMCRTLMGERIFELNFSTVEQSYGQSLRACCIAQDITERAESDRQRIAEQLASFEQERRMAAGLRALIENLPLGILVTREDQIVFANHAACTCLRWDSTAGHAGRSFSEFVPPLHREEVARLPDGTAEAVHLGELQVATGDGKSITAELQSVGIEFDGFPAKLLSVRDVTDLHKMEQDLRQAQRLEAIGRLAAGIAHEINTPIQFIGDNAHFIRQSIADLTTHIAAYQELLAQPGFESQLEIMKNREAELDIAFVREEAPKAAQNIIEGVSRVAKIVAAMKSFAHPGSAEKSPYDLNQALETTLVVATNEIKGAAQVVTEFGDIPPVPCHLGELNQVFLNLLVNASHAIRAKQRPPNSLGCIVVKTYVEGAYVVVSIADDGCGIRPEIYGHVFDPFFTTKAVGSGTGQGLAIAHQVVVNQHQGLIDFTSEVDKGTTFFVRLPVSIRIEASPTNP